MTRRLFLAPVVLLAAFVLLNPAAVASAPTDTFAIDGDNYLVIERDGAPTKIIFDTVMQRPINWFTQNGEYFATVTLQHNLPTATTPRNRTTLVDYLQFDLSSKNTSIDVRHEAGIIGDPPNRLMYYQEPYGAPYDGHYYLLEMRDDDDHAVTEVLALTDTALKVRIKGTATLVERRDKGESKAPFEAVITLKRTPFVRLPASQVFGAACDPTFYDRIPSAEYATPTDCELKFHDRVSQTIVAALTPVIAAFEQQGWHVQARPGALALNAIPRHYPVYSEGARLWLMRRTGEEDAAYREERSQAITSTVPLDRQTQERMALQQDIEANDQIEVLVAINGLWDDIVYRKPLTTYTVAGAVAIGTNDLRDDDAGDANLTPYRTFVWFGPVKSIAGKTSDGSSKTRITAVFDPKVPALAAQNVSIRIRCNSKLAADVIAKLDVQKLQELIYKTGK